MDNTPELEAILEARKRQRKEDEEYQARRRRENDALRARALKWFEDAKLKHIQDKQELAKHVDGVNLRVAKEREALQQELERVQKRLEALDRVEEAYNVKEAELLSRIKAREMDFKKYQDEGLLGDATSILTPVHAMANEATPPDTDPGNRCDSHSTSKPASSIIENAQVLPSNKSAPKRDRESEPSNSDVDVTQRTVATTTEVTDTAASSRKRVKIVHSHLDQQQAAETGASSEGNGSKSRTMLYEELYRAALPFSERGDRIFQKEPPSRGEAPSFYVLRCEQHNLFFGGAKRLAMGMDPSSLIPSEPPCHSEKPVLSTEGHVAGKAQTICQFGYQISDCTAYIMEQHNLWIAGINARSWQADYRPQDLHIGQIFHCRANIWGHPLRNAIVVALPVGRLAPLGPVGSLEDLSGFNPHSVPQCFEKSLPSSKIIGWSNGFEDGGHFAHLRCYPVFKFVLGSMGRSGRRERRAQILLRCLTGTLYWVPAGTLTPLDIDSQSMQRADSFKETMGFVKRIRGLSSVRGDGKLVRYSEDGQVLDRRSIFGDD